MPTKRSDPPVTRVTHTRSIFTRSQWLIVIALLVIIVIISGVLLSFWSSPGQSHDVPATARPSATPTLPPAIQASVTPTKLPVPTRLVSATLDSSSPNQIPLPTPSRKPSAIPSDAELQAFIHTMSLQDKVAQMVMIGFNGESIAASPELQTMIGTHHVGGVVLLEPNAHDPNQISSLTTELQTLATSSGARIPLFISSNHEGGTVVRIADGVTGFPGNMAVAATDRLEYAYIAAALSARELRAMGINMNLAPVLDVNDNPLNPVIGTRSFGDSPARVAEYGRMAVRGTQDNGVIAVAKHFPGHGSESVDSHGELPVVTEALDVMMQHGLIPFTAAIQEGVAAIMTAHIAIPALDNSGRPATLSPQIVTGLLRERLKFDGLIVTDSLGMGAVSAGRSQPQAAVEAVQAGADIVLSTGPMDAQIGMIRALAAGVQSGQIPIAQIDQSVLRILRVKHAFGLFDASGIDLTVVGLPDHQAVADQIALESVTLLRDNSDYIPIGAPPKRLLVISPDHLPSASSGNGTQFAELLRQHGYEVKELIVNLDSAENRNAVFAQATSQAAAQDVIIFGEWELIKRYVNWADQWQEQLMAALSKSGPPVIVVAWHNPAAILRSPSGAAFLTAYGNTRAQVKAVVDVLIGSAQAAGRLPMTLTTP